MLCQEQPVGVRLFMWLQGACASSGLGSAPSCEGLWRWLGLPKVAELETPPRGIRTPGGHHHVLAGRLPLFTFPSALSGLSNILWFSAMSSISLMSLKKFTICTHTINLSKGLCADQLQHKWLLQFGSQ